MTTRNKILNIINRTKQPAFTIVELLVVVVVIGILAAITVVSYTGITSQATASSLKSDLDNATKLLKIDQVSTSNYPATLAAANNGSGVPASSGTTYTYVVNNNISPKSFCISATKSSTTYMATESTSPDLGDCNNYLPILYLDAGSTNSYSGSGTAWTDLSGNSNNGTLVGGVSYSSSFGGSLLFDGTDDYITLPDLSAAEDKIFTYEAWVTAVSGISTDIIVAVAEGNSANLNTMSFISVGVASGYENQVHFRMRNDDASSDRTITTTMPTLLDGNPHQIAAVGDGTNIYVYFDGIQRTSAAIPTGTVTLDTTRVGVRPRATSREKYYARHIINARIYNRALSAAEISKSFNVLRNKYGL